MGAQSAQARIFTDTAASFIGLFIRMVSHTLQLRIEAVPDSFLYSPPQPARVTNRSGTSQTRLVNHAYLTKEA